VTDQVLPISISYIRSGLPARWPSAGWTYIDNIDYYLVDSIIAIDVYQRMPGRALNRGSVPLSLPSNEERTKAPIPARTRDCPYVLIVVPVL
jgi:hypothetical protein